LGQQAGPRSAPIAGGVAARHLAEPCLLLPGVEAPPDGANAMRICGDAFNPDFPGASESFVVLPTLKTAPAIRTETSPFESMFPALDIASTHDHDVNALRKEQSKLFQRLNDNYHNYEY
jgi:hypothetical protein